MGPIGKLTRPWVAPGRYRQWRGRSGWAAREAARSLRARGQGEARRWPRGLVHYPFVWMVLLSWIIQQLPIPLTIGILAPWPSVARSVITTWVTVVGAILALAMAVVVFAAQAFVGSRLGQYGGSLQDFAVSTGLLWILNGGVVALFAGGTALLGWGFGAPGGWSGTVAVIWGAWFVFSVPMVFWQVVGSVESRKLREWRLRHVREMSRSAAWKNALSYLAEQRIEEKCHERSIERPLFAWSRIPDERVLCAAPADGQVTDISLRRIGELADSAEPNATLSLHVRVGDAVRRGEPLVTSDVPVLSTSNVRLVMVTEPEPDRAVEFVDALHSEALDAIRSGQPSWYQSIVDTYAELLLGPAREMQRFGLPPDVGLRSHRGIFTKTPLDRVARNLYEELVEAVVGTGREVAFEAMYLPKRLAQEAAGLGAYELFANMVGLYPEAYSSLAQTPEPPLRDVLVDRSWRHLVETLEYPIGRDLAETTDTDEVAALAKFVTIADEQVVEVLRRAISAVDWRFVESALDGWLESLSSWVGYLDYAPGSFTPGSEDNTEARDLALARSSLVAQRHLWLFGLAMWALRVGTMRGSSEAIGKFLLLQDRLGTNEDLLRAASEALGGLRDHVFSHWIMMEVPPRRIHVGGADAELLAAFVGCLLVRASNSEIRELPPMEWLPVRLDAALRTVEELAGKPEVAEGLHIDDIDSAAQSVREMLVASAAAQRQVEDERQRRLPIPAESIEAISTVAQESWDNSRFVSRIFEALGRSAPSDIPEDLESWRRRLLVEKLFLQQDRESDLEHFGSELGRALSRGEVTALVRALAGSSSVRVPIAGLLGTLRNEVANLRDRGLKPTVVLLPVQWRLHSAIGLPWDPTGHPPPPSDLELRSGAVVQHIGSVAGVPAFYSAEVDDRHVYVIDLNEFGWWTYPPEDDGQQAHVEIVELTEADPAVMSAEAARKSELLKMARVEALERFAIRVDDPSAATVIHLEP